MSGPVPGPAREGARLVVCACSFADAETALRLAAPLLGQRAATLAGLLVGEAVADFALGAGQRVVTATGTLRDLPRGDRARALARAEARAFRTGLAAAARQAAAEWTFAEEPGELVARVCAAARGVDIVLVGQRPLARRRGPVLLLRPPDGHEADAQALADALARALGTGVVELEGADLLARIDRTAAAAVVADFGAGPLRGASDLRRLLAAARCPVAVLGLAPPGAEA